DGGQSWSLWQLKYTDRSGGVERAARIAIRRLRGHARRCGYTTLASDEAVRAAISGYAVGNGCSWSGADERVVTWRAYATRMRWYKASTSTGTSSASGRLWCTPATACGSVGVPAAWSESCAGG